MASTLGQVHRGSMWNAGLQIAPPTLGQGLYSAHTHPVPCYSKPQKTKVKVCSGYQEIGMHVALGTPKENTQRKARRSWLCLTWSICSQVYCTCHRYICSRLLIRIQPPRARSMVLWLSACKARAFGHISASFLGYSSAWGCSGPGFPLNETGKSPNK